MPPGCDSPQEWATESWRNIAGSLVVLTLVIPFFTAAALNPDGSSNCNQDDGAYCRDGQTLKEPIRNDSQPAENPPADHSADQAQNQIHQDPVAGPAHQRPCELAGAMPIAIHPTNDGCMAFSLLH